MKSEEAPLARAIGLGLLVLFVCVSLSVWGMAPDEQTPADQQDRLQDNLSALYFIDSENMVKKLLPNPSLGWSRDYLDDNSSCKYIGDGIWHAYGTVAEQTDHSQSLSSWQIYFLSDGKTPLYIEVGNLKSGDETFAQRKDSYR